MRFTTLTRLILCGALALLSAATSQAGGRIRQAVHTLTHPFQHCGQQASQGCGGCSSAPAQPQYAPPVATQGQPISYQTIYAPPLVTGGPAYQPIRMGFQLPTCVNGACGR